MNDTSLPPCARCRRTNEILTCYADHVVALEHERDQLRSERDQFRELLQLALAQLHSLTILVRRQRRCLLDRRDESYSDLSADQYAEAWIHRRTDRSAA